MIKFTQRPKEKIIFEYEELETLDDVRKQIRNCEGKHKTMKEDDWCVKFQDKKNGKQ